MELLVIYWVKCRNSEFCDVLGGAFWLLDRVLLNAG